MKKDEYGSIKEKEDFEKRLDKLGDKSILERTTLLGEGVYKMDCRACMGDVDLFCGALLSEGLKKGTISAPGFTRSARNAVREHKKHGVEIKLVKN